MTERDIFFEAMDMATPEARAAYLQGACGPDVTLRRKVEELLKEHFSNDSLLAGPALEGERIADDPPAQMLGRYKLLEKIGEGGFGEVWMAESRLVGIKRRVALKLIKLGMDSRQIVARFEAERQALAMMDHPNIAKIFDADVSDNGRPYFVMELVRGIKITEYCDQNQLPTQERLRLFILVCQAVQHAHQKGIIHRDIKPSNILVTLHDGVPVPKVIDFGIAKATQQELTDKTVFTQFQQFIGTPAYISPEQAEMSGLDIDTRADIYSLGVLLYELLVGQTPFDAKEMMQGGLDALRQIIREKEPLRPSTRLNTLAGEARTTAAKRRQTDVRKLVHQLQGDLDWIVMKCLEKDRTRRYDTANGLASDIQRHLNDEAVLARPPSATYRFQKVVRRNKLAFAAAAAVACALVIAISFAFLAYTARLSRLEEALATREAQEKHDRVLKTHQEQRRVRDADLPRIRQLIALEQFVPAFQLAQAAKATLPDDPEFVALRKQLVARTTITSEPSGARVSIRDWRAKDNEQWLELGQTPLHNVEVPQSARDEEPWETFQGIFRWRLEKEGYLTRELNAYVGQIASMAPIYMPENASVPKDMVYMPADRDDTNVGNFWIDRFEVTNRKFKEFVDAGGYERREYWEHEFLQEGKTIPWEEAVKMFRDETGKPGPAIWANGRYPGGQGNYPVRGLSWYEAAAYAKFVAKSLPTIHHWKSAANVNLARCIVPLSNFSDQGPAPVGSHRGIGRFDAYDMAGNVAEWCWNESEDHRRCLRGAAWDDPGYLFASPDALPPFDRSPRLGFRCVTYLKQPTVENLGPAAPRFRDFAAETPASPKQIEQYLSHYKYFRDLPLNERRFVEQLDSYVHETVRIQSAYNEEFDIHIFLPHRGRPPYEPIVIMPDGSAFNAGRFVVPPGPTSKYFMGLLDERRVVCWPVLKGTFERKQPPSEPLSRERDLMRERDLIILVAKDLSRTVDYLETRPEMDLDKLTFFGGSWGGAYGPTMLVVEPRFKAAILVAGGYWWNRKLPEVEPFQFAPYVKVPVLMVNGQYDPNCLLESLQRPFYRDLGSQDKLHVLFNSRHAPPIDQTLQAETDWLRERWR